MKNRLTIAIQKKGRLFNQSADLIKKSGINFSIKTDNLLAKANNMPIDILFVRSDDIPSLVSNGDADLAIVGENILLEKSLFKKTSIEKVLIELQRLSSCQFSRLTGSGSACFGLFLSKKSAELGLKKIKKKFPNYWCVTGKTI